MELSYILNLTTSQFISKLSFKDIKTISNHLSLLLRTREREKGDTMSRLINLVLIGSLSVLRSVCIKVR